MNSNKKETDVVSQFSSCQLSDWGETVSSFFLINHAGNKKDLTLKTMLRKAQQKQQCLRAWLDLPDKCSVQSWQLCHLPSSVSSLKVPTGAYLQSWCWGVGGVKGEQQGEPVKEKISFLLNSSPSLVGLHSHLPLCEMHPTHSACPQHCDWKQLKRDASRLEREKVTDRE